MDDVIIHKRPRYIRKGKCNRCGWCCLQEEPPCPHLIKEGEKYRCSIYNDKNKPMRCNLYPGNPPILHEPCGYYFIDIWEDNKIVKGKV